MERACVPLCYSQVAVRSVPTSQSLGHRRTWALLLGQDLCCLFLAEFGIVPVRLGATVHLGSSAGKEKGRRPSEGKFPGSVSRHVSGMAPARCGVADSFRVWSLPYHLPGPQCGRGACLCLCLSPVLADTASAVSQAWKASPCLCRAASFQKLSL